MTLLCLAFLAALLILLLADGMRGRMSLLNSSASVVRQIGWTLPPLFSAIVDRR